MNTTAKPTVASLRGASAHPGLPGVETLWADHEIVKRLGDWSTAGAFDLRARRASVVLDLRSAHMPEELSVHIALERSGVALLVADTVYVDTEGIDWEGVGRVKDPARTTQGARALGVDPSSAAVVVTGSAKGSEIRVLRGGSAQLTAMLSREYLLQLAQTRTTGVYPTLDDPRRQVALPGRRHVQGTNDKHEEK